MCVLRPLRNILLSQFSFFCFISLDFESEFPAAIKALTTRLRDGSVKRKFHIVEGGIEQAPGALPMLFNGGNTGKL